MSLRKRKRKIMTDKVIILLIIGVIGFTLILNNYLEHHPVFGLDKEEANLIAADSCDDRDCSTVVVPYHPAPTFQDR